LDLLLDTHVFLWWIAGDAALSQPSIAAIGDTGNRVFVSAASAWETATKFRIGKLPNAVAIAANHIGIVDAQGFEPLPITFATRKRPARFPAHTKTRSTGC
jgi:PIN domain nuclease of toxin-antitoxin system